MRLGVLDPPNLGRQSCINDAGSPNNLKDLIIKQHCCSIFFLYFFNFPFSIQVLLFIYTLFLASKKIAKKIATEKGISIEGDWEPLCQSEPLHGRK